MRRHLARFKAWLRTAIRQLLDVPDNPHVVEHFTEHGEVIDGLRRDLDAVQQLLVETVRQLNITTVNAVHMNKRLVYYEQHSAIIQKLRDEMIRAEKKAARENGARAPIEVVQ
jgi:hypothetical protein